MGKIRDLAQPGRTVSSWLHWLLPVFVVAAAPVLLFHEGRGLQRFHAWVFDGYQRLRPRVYEDVGVRVVDIDDESQARLRTQWPWPRTMLAEVVRRLHRFGAAAIAFDTIFSEPDRTSPKEILSRYPEPSLRGVAMRLPDHDRSFASSLADARVALAFALTPEETSTVPLVKASFVIAGGNPVPLLWKFAGVVADLPLLEAAAAGNGSITYIPEPGGLIHHVPLVMRIGDRLVPSLLAESLRVSQAADTYVLKTTGFQGREGSILKVKIGGLVIPTDGQGRMWTYLTPEVATRKIPIWRIFDPSFDGKGLSGAIVFIGTSAMGLKDQRATALSDLTPGVDIQAQAAEQVLLKRFLVRPDWAADVETSLIVLVSLALILLLQRRGAIWGAVFCLFAIGAFLAAGWWAFVRQGWLLDPLLPSLTLGTVYVSFALTNYLQGEREKREIRRAFQYYLSPELVERLARQPESLRLGGELRRMTFHFCDIEGFTSISEFYDPRGLIPFLNSYLSPLTEIILKHHGTIDKYMGDCIMAFWNAPIDDPNHAANACRAVIEMHERLGDLNADRRRQAEISGREFTPIRIRTGLNSGSCMVGNMGSYQRFNYSVLGDEVNLASRLEGANKFFGTYAMASEATVSLAQGAVETRRLGRVRVEGRVVPIVVYELLGRKGELSEVWTRALPIYERGLEAYVAREFAEAARAFQEVLELVPRDGPSAVYLGTATEYSRHPPPDSWDAVFHLRK